MRRFRSRRFAMLLILMLTLSLVFQGVAPVAFAEGEAMESQGDVGIQCTKTLTVTKDYVGESAGEVEIKLEVEKWFFGYYWQEVSTKTTSGLTAVFTMSTDRDHFRIKEVNVPSGYQVSYPDGQEIWIYNNNPSGSLRVLNTSDKVDLKVIKTINDEQGLAHEGVEFKLLDISNGDAEFGSGVTDVNGELVFSDLMRDHDYRLVETVPVGYETNLATDNVIDPSGEPSAMMVYPVVNSENGSIIIHKSFTGGYEGSKFVCFSLYKVEDQIGDASTLNGAFRTECQRIDGSGDFTFEGLPFGTYRVVEKAMPRFYQTDLNEELTYMVNLDSLVKEVTVVNSYVSPITLEKTVVPAIANIGDEVTYIFKVKNIGEYNLYHAQIKDLDIPFDAYHESSDDPSILVYEGEYLEPGEEWTVSTTHVLTAEDMAGGSFTNTATAKAYTCSDIRPEKPDITPVSMTETDIEAACMRLCIWVEASDNATVTLPGSTPTVTTTTTTTERDRAEPAGSFIPPEPVPLGTPVVIPAPVLEPIISDEVIPLGVPVLPKTAELPMEIFYGLGGMLTVIGAYMKRR